MVSSAEFHGTPVGIRSPNRMNQRCHGSVAAFLERKLIRDSRVDGRRPAALIHQSLR